jgi:hypothetical protein
MKKLLYVFVAVLAFGLTSCDKCVDCTGCALGADGEICEEDYNSKDDYDDAVALAESAGGCDCK